MVIDQAGGFLGWVPSGGGPMQFQPDKTVADITDPWLSVFLNRIQRDNTPFFDDVSSALLTIEPNTKRRLLPGATLCSRPLAIARVAVGIDLKGAPASHQGYEALAMTTLDAEGKAMEITTLQVALRPAEGGVSSSTTSILRAKLVCHRMQVFAGSLLRPSGSDCFWRPLGRNLLRTQ